MAVVLVTILEIYSLALLARALLSWFRPDPSGPVGQINEGLIKITEPVVGPVRRMLPRTGPIDLSTLLVLLVINIILVPIAASL